MTKKVQFTLDFDANIEDYLENNFRGYVDYRILSQSLDARGAPRGKRPRYNYTVDILFPGEEFNPTVEKFVDLGDLKLPPIIIGAGPAGLFCALRLLEYGTRSVIFERGDSALRRMLSIAKFWRYGELNLDTNVCYGEGGAGLFSDGKLITRIKSPYVQYVMNRLVSFGAPKETAYLSNPHLGSNKIRALIGNISAYLTSSGCQIYYNKRVDKILFKNHQVVGVRLADGTIYETGHVVAAFGHSAKEMYEHLAEEKVAMTQKDFAIGVRIEHPRSLIDKIQYGTFEGDRLGAARYRLSYENKETKKGTYSFCMCPGGHVLSSGTNEKGIVVNGMSNYARRSPWSNSALVVSVKSGIDYKNDHLLNGLYFQHDIENKAYEYSREFASGRELPAISVEEFLNKTKNSKPLPKSSTPSGTVKADLSKILPPFVIRHLEGALVKFDESMKGLISDKALLLAPETRTSSPVTITRDFETLESPSYSGLYPCGEGAGHAGGITSAAVDGVKVAMAILFQEKNYSKENNS